MKERQVGIELLRILSMLMVLGLHANFMALGAPTLQNITSSSSILQCFIQSLCIVAVNVFVMISGWFGIRPSIKGFCNFMWQVMFFVGSAYIIESLFFGQKFVFKDIFKFFGLFGGGGWFVSAYIGLYILAPVLNKFIECSSKKHLKIFLLVFFIFEIIWGDTLSTSFIACGYSTFSFIGLYVLAAFLRKINLNLSSKKLLTIYLLTTVVNTITYIVCSRLNVIFLKSIILNYINPFVIVGASSLLLLFTKSALNTVLTNKTKKIILFISSSCFSAYLLHAGTPYAIENYCQIAKNIYIENSSVLYLIKISIYILTIFSLGVLLDQFRKFIWGRLLFPFFHNKSCQNQGY